MKIELIETSQIKLIPETIQDKVWLTLFMRDAIEECSKHMGLEFEKNPEAEWKGGGCADPKKVGIFDEKFKEEIKKSQYQNLAVDTVRKLLDQEIVTRMRTNKARYETMLTMLTDLIEKYENNVISSAEIIKKLLEIADEIKKLDQEGQALGLSGEEITFYDTLAADPDLKNAGINIQEFVKDLTKRIRRDLTIDWTNNETIKARIRQNVRLLLIQRGIVQQQQTERLIDCIYQETVRVYREYTPAYA